MAEKKKAAKKPKKAAPQTENGKADVAVTHTVAPPISESAAPPISFHAAHAEAVQAQEQSNKQFQQSSQPEGVASKGGSAIATLDVPAHQREVSLAFSEIPGCAIAAVHAWEAVRGSEPAFQNCVSTHREKLVAHAESVYRSGQAMSGNTILARFERKVAEIKAEQDKEAS